MTNGSENDREIKEILVEKSWQDPLEREMPKGSSGSRLVRSQMVWKWRKEHPGALCFPQINHRIMGYLELGGTQKDQ